MSFSFQSPSVLHSMSSHCRHHNGEMRRGDLQLQLELMEMLIFSFIESIASFSFDHREDQIDVLFAQVEFCNR